MGYLKNLLIALDQFGNVIAGGNPDNTVSARVGKFNHDADQGLKVGWYWIVFKKIIDFAFYPIDGPGHCHEAYFSDIGETFDTETNNIAFITIQFIFIVPVCTVIAILTYIAWGLGFTSPREINRSQEISNRLYLTHAKLKGVEHEILEHPAILEKSLVQEAEVVTALALCVEKLIKAKINDQPQ